MILKDTAPVHVHNQTKIRRKHSGVVLSKHETTEYNVVFKNLCLVDNFDCLP